MDALVRHARIDTHRFVVTQLSWHDSEATP